MFGAVLGVIGVVSIVLTVIELATRDKAPTPPAEPAPPNPALAPNAANVRDALALPPSGDLPAYLSKSERAKFYAYASQCNATAQDIRDTTIWLNQQLGGTIPLPFTAQLNMMHSKVPLAFWPRAARRAACVMGV